ncbi:MAG: hypothetical protein C0501_13655 [Isosphaera sp.]|nr:hypothetical protein [Isosphaera sp.]
MMTPVRTTTGAFPTLADEGAETAPVRPTPPPRIDLAGFLGRPENRSAVRAVRRLARAVLTGNRLPFAPLVLHGPPGCGKTALTAAALAALAAEAPALTARVAPAGDLARPDDAGFADPDLADCDVLVLEDLQHLPARAAGAAADLLDHRAARRRPTVVTAGVGPAGLRHLPRRLTSRLAAGLVVRMDPLGAAGRRAVLAAAARNLRLTHDALDWLAAGVGLRAGLGRLRALALAAPDFPGPLDRTAAERVLAGSGQPTSRPDDLAAIMGRVCVAFGVGERELLGPSRLRTVLVPRQVAMYLAREVGRLSLPRIGAAFGRDHTTVLHACRKVEADVAADAELAGRVRQLRQELG